MKTSDENGQSEENTVLVWILIFLLWIMHSFGYRDIFFTQIISTREFRAIWAEKFRIQLN